MPGEPALTDRQWQVSSSVSLRPEPFGALAYDFHTRQLSFLKTPQLADTVRNLAGAASVAAALEAAGVTEEQYPAYLAALASLARQGILEETTS